MELTSLVQLYPCLKRLLSLDPCGALECLRQPAQLGPPSWGYVGCNPRRRGYFWEREGDRNYFSEKLGPECRALGLEACGMQVWV